MSALVEIRNLTVAYDGVPAVVDASLDINRNEILAVVGESGSGKSTLARAIVGLSPAQSGTLFLEGTSLAFEAQHRSPLMRRRIGMVFQDSGSAFNPRLKIVEVLSEPLKLSGMKSTAKRLDTIVSLLADVGLPTDVLSRYPNELSGGQRQRIGIVRALACRPDVLICDEAVSALDVSVQAQILNLLVDIQAKHNLALMFITHDFAVVEYLADRIAVMKHGRIVEQGEANSVLDNPKHPFTRELLETQSHNLPVRITEPAHAQ